MKKLFFLIVSILISITVVRLLVGSNEPMTLTRFLRIFSNVNISFSNTLDQISVLRNSLQFPEIGDLSFFNASVEFFKWCYVLTKNLLFVPIEILHDVLDFLASILVVFYQLLY